MRSLKQTFLLVSLPLIRLAAGGALVLAFLPFLAVEILATGIVELIRTLRERPLSRATRPLNGLRNSPPGSGPEELFSCGLARGQSRQSSSNRQLHPTRRSLRQRFPRWN
jgi:hypothetical protein